jgi:hypothetical protein
MCGAAAWVAAVVPTLGSSPALGGCGKNRAWGALEPPTWALLRAWAPVNILFVAMVWTSFAALASLGIPMASILKNLTNLFVICGDYWLRGRTYGRRVWTTLGLLAASAVCGAATDLAFSVHGYCWQLANCAATAAYSLALRESMDRVAGLTATRKVPDHNRGCDGQRGPRLAVLSW